MNLLYFDKTATLEATSISNFKTNTQSLIYYSRHVLNNKISSFFTEDFMPLDLWECLTMEVFYKISLKPVSRIESLKSFIIFDIRN